MKIIRSVNKILQHAITALFCLTPLQGLYAFSFFLSTQPLQTSGITLSNAYYKITAYTDGISSIQIDPTGSFGYSTNITEGLLIDNLYSTNGSSVSIGSDYVYFENLSMIDGTNSFTADWQITLDGKTLKNRTICTTGHTHPASTVKVNYLMEVPLENSGYITNINDTLFSRFITDTGQYVPIQMLKRRNEGSGSTHLLDCTEIRACGTKGYDILFAGNMDTGLAGTEHFAATGSDSYLIDTKIIKAGILGQTMTWDMSMNLLPHSNAVQKVGVQIPTWNTTDSHVTLRLRKGGPDGDVITWQRFYNIPNNSWRWLTVSDLPAGKYYLEMLNPKGMVGWFTATNCYADSGAATINSTVTNGCSRWIKTISSENITNEYGAYSYPPKRLTEGQTYGQSFTIRENIPEYYPEIFTSGDSEQNALLNEFLWHGSFMSLNETVSEMEEWMALKTAWADNPMKSVLMTNFLDGVHPVDTNGYVYTQGGLEGNLLLELFGPEGLDTRYFRNNPMYILSAWRLYNWTGNTNFLTNMMPVLRDVLDFIKTEQSGSNGLAIINADQHDGRNGSWGASSWYFETLPFGHKDALLNVYFYAALRAMAELERACSRPVPAANLETLSDTVKTNFNNTFWDETEGRYVGCVDINGESHDYGYAYINLQAIAYGLANSNQQASIFQWLENEPTASGTNDVFSRWQISPRSSTIANPFPTATESNGWWRAGVNGDYEWEEPTHNGGTCVQFLFYEMLARIQTYGASNAWDRFTHALERYGQPDRLCGADPLYFGETKKSLLPMNAPNSETGVAPSAFIHGFLGAVPDQSKLVIEPKVPEQLDYIGIRNLCYKDCLFDIKACSNQIEVNCTAAPSGADIRVDMIPLPAGGCSYPTNRIEIKVF